MRFKTIFLWMIVAAAMIVANGQALYAKIERTPVYIFGFSASFTDSLVYMTNIQCLDSAWVDTKTDFLIDRPIYSDQFQSYLEAKGLENRTCVVFFNVKKKKAEDRFNEIKKRYGKDASVIVKMLENNDFKFAVPAYYGADENDK